MPHSWPSQEHPPAVCGPVEAVITIETGSADREANMWAFAHKAVELLEACLRTTPGA